MRHIVLSACVFTALGCAKPVDSGELGQASLLPTCPTCSHISFPLAVGALQKVEPKAVFGGTTGVPLTLLTVDPSVVGVEGSGLRGVAPGVTAMLALTPAGKVLDFFHVTTVAADQFALAALDQDGLPRGELEESVTWLVGDDVMLRAIPKAGDQELVGQLDSTWSTSSDVLTLLPGLVPSEWRVVARSAGSAQITIAAPGIERRLNVEVLP